ncbi:MAG: metal ABC transporter ATP-binding protein [Tepidisphaeraceae bacterium]
MDSVLDIRDLDFAYRDRAVLTRINLSVARGHTLGVIGPNGGGKTTLLRLMLGIVKPTRGMVRVCGLPPREAVRRGDLVGYLPQNPTLAPHFPIDVTDLVRLGLLGRTGMLRGHARDDLAFVDELIDRVGLSNHRRTPIGELSGGQLQRALIARALAPRPTLLLLDEPTVGIDQRGQQDFITLITQLRDSLGLTVVFVSHDLRAVASISDRIACVGQTLHFHDTPHHLPADLVYSMFKCDLATLGIGGPRCDDPACDGYHAPIPLPAITRPIALPGGPL